MKKSLLIATLATALALPTAAMAWAPTGIVPFKIPKSQKFHGKRPIHGFYHKGVVMVKVNPKAPQCVLHGYQPAARAGYCIDPQDGGDSSGSPGR